MVDGPAAAAEFSRPVAVGQIGAQESVREIEASAAERAAVAARLDLVALHSLRASLRLRRRSDGLVQVSGRFVAEPVQRCVVTLEPVPVRCDQPIDLLYGEVVGLPAPGAEIEIDVDAGEEPEAIEHGRIDLGEAVVQELAVSLDPYPRAPGAEIPDTFSAPEDAVERHPFGALETLKRAVPPGEEAARDEKPGPEASGHRAGQGRCGRGR